MLLLLFFCHKLVLEGTEVGHATSDSTRNYDRNSFVFERDILRAFSVSDKNYCESCKFRIVL